jgi:hypothetical protein
MVKSTSIIVQDSIIGNGFGKIDFCDSYSIVTTKSESVDKITAIVFGGVKWLDNLFAPLYKIVKCLGLNAMKKEPYGEEPYFPIGSKAVMFTVIDRKGNEIVMGESESILDFRTSVLKEVSGNKTIVHLTTIVKYNNMWGRLYFFPVKPFHRFICKQILKNYTKVKN